MPGPHRKAGTSGRVTSVTIGNMPGRQIIVYDKRHEVIQKKKGFWWEIWNDARRRESRPQLNPNEKEASQVWRVELRAGKKHLKDRWGITTWEDFDNKLGDLYLRAISDIRYITEAPDTNRARWPNHPLWDVVRNEVSGDLFEMASGVGPGVIKEILRNDLCEMLSHQIVGLSASLGSALGLGEDAASEIPEIVARDLEMYLEERPKDFARKMERAGSRYVFLDERN